MRVLLVDDQILVRDGFASLLMARNIEVVGEASDGLEALHKARELNPDIILMDVKMPRCNGLEATRLIKAEMPHIKIIVLTVSEDDEDLFNAIKSGAEGYVLKNIKAKEFYSLLSGVSKGEAAISSLVAAKIIKEIAHQTSTKTGSPKSTSAPTDRENDILSLVATGTSNKEIASTLMITENTVKYHLRHIMQKLRLKNRVQMAAYAVSKGITPRQPPESN